MSGTCLSPQGTSRSQPNIKFCISSQGNAPASIAGTPDNLLVRVATTPTLLDVRVATTPTQLEVRVV